MVINKFDSKYKFRSVFNTRTGFYVRSGVMENGIDTGIDPFMASFPELIDIGIMGHCAHGLSGKCKESGVQCYQHGDISKNANMTLEDYKSVIDECKGKTFQDALGGCGDPDMHPDFEEIIRYTREANIVPNFTTSGFGMTKEKAELCKMYCGSVAVSWYRSKYTTDTIELLLNCNVQTNVHFVLGRNTIDEALDLLTNRNGKSFPRGINAVIFLLHKPVGLGEVDNVLDTKDPRVMELFRILDTETFEFKIGFGSCSIPGIINFMNTVDYVSVDTCEAARWSMYITPDMIGLPCSFDNQSKLFGVNIKEVGSIQAVWDSEQFGRIRNTFKTRCKECPKHRYCLGGCPLMEVITLCDRGERK